MDRNTIIGFILIFAVLMGYNYLTAPTPEQIAERERIADSLQNEKIRQDSLDALLDQPKAPTVPTEELALDSVVTDSARQAQQLSQQAQTFGEFALSSVGEAKDYVLENDLFKLTFSSKGGFLRSAELKNFAKIAEDSTNNEIELPLELLEDRKNRFDFEFPTASGRKIKSGDLFFEVAEQSKNSITFRAKAGNGYFEQSYSIVPESYNIDYNIGFVNMGNAIASGTETVQLEWVNYLDKLEKNVQYEQRYSSIYYKEVEEDVTYCSCTSDDSEEINTGVKWFSHSNQFFNSTLIAKNRNFKKGYFKTEMRDLKDSDLKKLVTQVAIPVDEDKFAMQMYVGPNEFNRLQAYEMELEYVIPFGSSIFGSINRWVIRPLFNFLSGFIGNAGLVILMLTLIVKLLLYPFMFKMLKSQSLMAALKPKLEKAKAKHKDDQQAIQMETMKLYREYGVNPLGGCLPMIAQMPVWFALYRFFPAAIEFRQKGFLWATDLSSYDAPFTLPFEIPFYGDHVSLFTLLWAGTTVLYTYYNSRHLDMGANPAMKYMQYFMPIMFLFFFNSFAAGLTCYLFFSNTFNIAQTLITKNVILDKDKLLAELEDNKNKPKKKSGFGSRLEEAMKQAQAQQAAQEKTKKRRK